VIDSGNFVIDLLTMWISSFDNPVVGTKKSSSKLVVAARVGDSYSSTIKL